MDLIGRVVKAPGVGLPGGPVYVVKLVGIEELRLLLELDFEASSREMWTLALAFSSSFIQAPVRAFSSPCLMYSSTVQRNSASSSLLSNRLASAG